MADEDIEKQKGGNPEQAGNQNYDDGDKCKKTPKTMGYNDYESFQDEKVCIINDLAEDNVSKCFGYKENAGKKILYYLGVVCTVGFLWLITYWKPNWKLYLTHFECKLEVASSVLLIDQFGTIFVESVVEDAYPQHFLPFHEKGDYRKGRYRYFFYRRLKYYFHEESLSFAEVENADDNITTHGIYQLLTNNPSDRKELVDWFGCNTIDIKVTSYLSLFFQECADPFYIFQLFSCVLWFSDEYYYYAAAIVLISMTSIVLSIYQTHKHLVTLHNMIAKSSMVNVLGHNGDAISIHSSDLVPGDILVIPKEGTTLLCDAALISGTAIVNESMLTGESIPVTKTAISKPPSKNEGETYNTLKFKRNTLFCGTNVLQTRFFGDEKVLAVVVKTGFTTMKGELIRSILYPKPVDFKFISDALKFVGVLAIFATVGLIYSLVIFYLHGSTIAQMVKKALDVITIAVPPALPAAMSVGTVYALQRLKKERIYCISPSRINISGHLNLFCFDKTGTLTEDGLDFCGVIPLCENEFNDFQESIPKDCLSDFTIAMACCHSLTIIDGHITGDPLDLKMFEATGWDLEESGSEETERYGSMVPTIVRPKITAAESVRIKYLEDKSLPLEVAILKQFTFSSELQRMSVIVRRLGAPNMEVFVKGSPEMIASLSLKESLPDNFEQCLMSYTKQGYRVLALAYKPIPKSVHWHKIQHFVRSQAECDLNFLGLIVMKNLLKPVTVDVINKLETANIRTVMVTGDNMLTAVSVARECNMVRSNEKIVSITEGDGGKFNFHLVGEMEQADPTTMTTETNHSDASVSFYKISTDSLEKYAKRDYHFAVTGKVFGRIHEKDTWLFDRLLVCGTIFARMLPDQKTLLVNSLQDLGYSVGMCGDGANDCGALKRANAGISLSETEASVASPFTSKTPNISCVVDVIKEGRCALVTSFNIFKYMALYSMIQYTSVLIMYWVGVNMSDLQYLYIDLFTIMPIAITMSRTKPSGVLAATRPLGRLVHPHVLFSLITQIFIQTGFQVAAYLFVRTVPYYQPMDVFANQTNDNDGPLLAYENTILFLLTGYQYIIVALVFSVGKPFRKPFYTNLWFLLSTIVLCAFTTFLSITPIEAVRKAFDLLETKSDGYYYYVFFGLVAANLVVSAVVEFVVMETDFMKDCLDYHDTRTLTKYNAIQKDIFEDSTWKKKIIKMSVENITLDNFKAARHHMKKNASEMFHETPLAGGMEKRLIGKIPGVESLSFKLESVQNTGSFKIRGVLNQFLNLSEEDRRKQRCLVTLSAGNYGKAFAFVCHQLNMPGIVCMPNSAPMDRQVTIEAYGCTVHRSPPEELLDNVQREVERTNGLLLHSYDDFQLILGNASAGLELVEQLDSPPDIILICCGGGGLCAGVATAVKLSGWKDTLIYGVEPQNVPKMYEAMKAGGPVPFKRYPTIATGLSSPTAGEGSYKLIKKYTDGILLVTEEELKTSMRTLYSVGLVVEPSGAAAFAALQSNKVPDAEGKKVVVIVTGGNVTMADLAEHTK